MFRRLLTGFLLLLVVGRAQAVLATEYSGGQALNKSNADAYSVAQTITWSVTYDNEASTYSYYHNVGNCNSGLG